MTAVDHSTQLITTEASTWQWRSLSRSALSVFLITADCLIPYLTKLLPKATSEQGKPEYLCRDDHVSLNIWCTTFMKFTLLTPELSQAWCSTIPKRSRHTEFNAIIAIIELHTSLAIRLDNYADNNHFHWTFPRRKSIPLLNKIDARHCRNCSAASFSFLWRCKSCKQNWYWLTMIKKSCLCRVQTGLILPKMTIRQTLQEDTLLVSSGADLF